MTEFAPNDRAAALLRALADDPLMSYKAIGERLMISAVQVSNQLKEFDIQRVCLGCGKAGRIRASYDGMDPGSKPLILRDVKTLLAEPPPG